TLRVMGDIQRRYGVDACRRYVISFTRDAGDVARVYELAERACREPPVLDVVPLLETDDDLRRATFILDGVLALPPVQRRVGHHRAPAGGDGRLLGLRKGERAGGGHTGVVRRPGGAGSLGKPARRPPDALSRSGWCPGPRRRTRQPRGAGTGARLGRRALQG